MVGQVWLGIGMLAVAALFFVFYIGRQRFRNRDRGQMIISDQLRYRLSSTAESE